MDANQETRGLQRLLAHVLILALEDHSKPAYQEDAQAFFDSPGLEWIAHVLNLNPSHIRQKISTGLDPAIFKMARRSDKNEKDGAITTLALCLTRTKSEP